MSRFRSLSLFDRFFHLRLWWWIYALLMLGLILVWIYILLALLSSL